MQTYYLAKIGFFAYPLTKAFCIVQYIDYKTSAFSIMNLTLFVTLFVSFMMFSPQQDKDGLKSRPHATCVPSRGKKSSCLACCFVWVPIELLLVGRMVESNVRLKSSKPREHKVNRGKILISHCRALCRLYVVQSAHVRSCTKPILGLALDRMACRCPQSSSDIAAPSTLAWCCSTPAGGW